MKDKFFLFSSGILITCVIGIGLTATPNYYEVGGGTIPDMFSCIAGVGGIGLLYSLWEMEE